MNNLRNRSMPRIVVLLCAAACTTACAVGPNFKEPAPQVPTQWSQPTAASANAGSPANWWTSFNDATLSSLVERAAASNLDAKQAVLRIEEARAQRDVTAGGRWPQVSINAGLQRQRISENTLMGAQLAAAAKSGASISNPYNQFQLGADVSWEVDLFGRVSRSIEAADAEAQASEEDRRAMVLSLCSEVARSYISLRGAQLSLQITRDALATQRELLELTQQRQSVGLTNDLDVSNAAALVANSEAQLPSLDNQVSQSINQLSQLLAREPNALRAELEVAQAVPLAQSQIELGIPADVTRRRPDIRRAEARLHAATARAGVAVADLYPRLRLGASAGWQAQDAVDMSDWSSRFFSIGPQLELPIFNGGQRRATVRLQNVREQEAALEYQSTVLAALHEVENALAAYKNEQLRRDSLANAVTHAQDAVDLAKQRYQSGIANFLEVLDAERNLQQDQLQLAQSTASVSSNLVVLYKALGGGWESFKQ